MIQTELKHALKKIQTEHNLAKISLSWPKKDSKEAYLGLKMIKRSLLYLGLKMMQKELTLALKWSKWSSHWANNGPYVYRRLAWLKNDSIGAYLGQISQYSRLVFVCCILGVWVVGLGFFPFSNRIEFGCSQAEQRSTNTFMYI